MPKPFPVIPGFTVLEQAGEGGMGTVYVARQQSPDRKVALKVLSRAPDAHTLADFRREAELIAGLEHPRIVPLYGYGEIEGLPFLVMRFIGSGSLADRIPMGLAEAGRWLKDISEALDFAHERGLIHRDIKPSNILLDEQGNAYLGDFGIAGTLADIESSGPTGSAAYMSPEQGRGEGIDARSDTYSLAVTLFEALTGQQPYTSETPLGVIARHMHYPVPSASELDPSIQSGVNEAIQRGMAKDPADRPATSGEFVDLVLRAPTLPLSALEESAPSARWLRWPAIAAVLGLLAALVVGGGALLGVGSSQNDLPDPTATLPVFAEEQVLPEGDPPEENGPAEDNAFLLIDDFSSPQSGFGVFSDEDGGVEYADGALSFTVLTEGARWYSPSGRVAAEDVVIEATAQKVMGPAMSEVALLCRWVNLANFTALAVRDDGSVAIWQVRKGVIAMLKDWSPDFSGFPDGPILLHVTCRGNELRLEAAGQVVAEAIDPFPVAGDIALMVGLGEQAELEVLFDEVRVSP